MIERAFWRFVRICWYAAIIFLFCVSMVLADKNIFVESYISLVVMAVMMWISIQANKGGKK